LVPELTYTTYTLKVDERHGCNADPTVEKALEKPLAQGDDGNPALLAENRQGRIVVVGNKLSG
jgi:hypothetical protein